MCEEVDAAPLITPRNSRRGRVSSICSLSSDGIRAGYSAAWASARTLLAGVYAWTVSCRSRFAGKSHKFLPLVQTRRAGCGPVPGRLVTSDQGMLLYHFTSQANTTLVEKHRARFRLITNASGIDPGLT